MVNDDRLFATTATAASTIPLTSFRQVGGFRLSDVIFSLQFLRGLGGTMEKSAGA